MRDDFKFRDPRRAWPRLPLWRRLFQRRRAPVLTLRPQLPTGPTERADDRYAEWLAEWRARQPELRAEGCVAPVDRIPMFLRRQAD